jgi:hypothetical protein
MKKQAVVVIHGVGEQVPMGTLRSFVNAVLPDPQQGDDRVKYFSKPDRMSESFELRKLQSWGGRPQTDFYEYYWASHVEGTKYCHMLAWIKTLLLRLPGDVPSRLRLIWVATWILTGVFAVSAVMYYGSTTEHASSSVLNSRLAGLVASALLIPILQSFVLNYVGDAARYLSPTPSNISIRQRILSDGIKLLRQLHARGDYDRIVLVGHSLGSVIAYDLLKYYWQEVNTKHGHPAELDQLALKATERAGRALTPGTSADGIRRFQDKQNALWDEQRKYGNPWLVTDLITLGSPLVHAPMLLAKNGAELLLRQQEREAPTCPPHADHGCYSYRIDYKRQDLTEPRTIFVLHHAALFACTRWTNIYFPGDFVGGPLTPVFGPGIRDVRVTEKGLGGLIAYTPLSHTRYWRKFGSSGEALHTLKDALALERKKHPHTRSAAEMGSRQVYPVASSITENVG